MVVIVAVMVIKIMKVVIDDVMMVMIMKVGDYRCDGSNYYQFGSSNDDSNDDEHSSIIIVTTHTILARQMISL